MRWRLGWIALGVLVTGCGSTPEGSTPEGSVPESSPPEPKAGAAAAAQPRPLPPDPLPLLAATQSARDALAARYRLPPDRRALIAGADLDRWLGGDGTPVTASWNGVGWTLRQGAREVGRLPELPSYADLAGWLDAMATVRRGSPAASATAPSVASTSPLLSTREAFALARAAGARLAAAKPAAWADGAHALAALALQLHDSFGTNAGLKARALALVTLARAEGTLARADEVLVAAALGYRGAAAQLAEALPEGDAVRAFALRDDARLVEMTSPGARRLALRRQVERRNGLEARSWVVKHLGAEGLELHVIGARLELASFDDRGRVARATPGLLALHAKRELSPAGSEAHQALSGRDMEAALAALGPDEHPWATLETAIAALPPAAELGPLLAGPPGGEDLLRASYRSLAHDAVAVLGIWTLGQQASAPQADALIAELASQGAPADDVSWLRLYRGVFDRSLDRKLMAPALAELPFFDGAAQLVLDSAVEHADWAGLDVLPLARIVVGRMDTRVGQRELWSRWSRQPLIDAANAEKLARSAYAEDPGGQPKLRRRLALLDGDVAALRTVLADANERVEDKLDVLGSLLAEHQLEARELPAQITALGPLRRWQQVQPAMALLEQQGELAAARRLAQDFLVAGEITGLDGVFARTEIARMLQAEKHLTDAWQEIEPALDSYQSYALARGALIQQALGHEPEALELAQKNVGRYPTSSEALGVLAEVHWRARRHDEAAAALAARRLTPKEWRSTIGRHLAALVADDGDAPGAVRALTQAKIPPPHLASMLSMLPTSPQHVAQVVELYRVLATAGPSRLEMLGYAALLLQSARGPAAASAFLKAEVPASELGAFGQFAFSRRLDDALWSVVPLALPGADLDASLWLFRTGAALRAGPNDPHREELTAHYRGDSPSHYHVLGRHLLGLTDEASALALGHDRRRSVEVAYYLGLKADVERRLPDAIAWYRVALESNERTAYETQLAFQRLGGWRQSGKSLARLAALPAAADTPTF
jgi:tetratricopeptide (TPR) repeat protein